MPSEVPNSATPRAWDFPRVVRGMRARLERLNTSARDFAAKYPNWVRGLAAVAILLAAISGWFVYEVLLGLPGRDELRGLGESTELTTIYDAHDRRVFSIPTEHRIEVSIDQMSKHLKNAMVAVEDVRFYEHDGIDGVRVIGAVLADIRERRAAEGASTITQQLARMSFLNRDKTLRRKVKEAVLAQRIEKLYSKDEILEFYLNKVYFGDGLYGAEAAARGYFGKPASRLTLAEGAMLAGLVRAPSASNPTVNPERAIERRNLVLKLMLENKLIDNAEYESAMAAQVALRDDLRREDPSGVHFKEQVRRQLIELFGKEKVYEGRLKVYATIDSEATAFLMATMLADVVDAGTANRARSLGFTLPAAGKTGTTDDFVDAWFVGFTPKIVTGVWVGFDRPRTIIPNGFAGQLAVPLWARFMKVATKNDGKIWFDPPPDVVAVQVCRVSGNLPVAGCKNAASINRLGEISYKSMVYTEYFVRGTEPERTCSVHSMQALPYPETYFTVTGFDTIGDALNMETLPPPTEPVSNVLMPPPPPRQVPDLPTAPPEARPEPRQDSRPEPRPDPRLEPPAEPRPDPPPAQNPASALPPPEPPEPPPPNP